jgi:hypothetical protein
VAPPELALSELVDLASAHRLSSTFGAARGEPIVVVHLERNEALDGHRLPDTTLHELGIFPGVVVGTGSRVHPARSFVDVFVEPDLVGADLAALIDGVTRHPLASTALCLLLRHGDDRSIDAGLVAESTTYSMLQGGPEFAEWLAGRERLQTVDNKEPSVSVDVDDDTRVITLRRPSRHNAIDAQMTERLVEALVEAIADPRRRVVLRGAGPSFSSGGDLAEFGSFADPVTAHAVRLGRSVGHLIAMLSDRIEAQLHGACFGAGIELSAFAGTVVASADVRIALPEVSMGLVPGAGGTVSVPRRIGRHRAALLAITGVAIDAVTAHRWGLVDQVKD